MAGVDILTKTEIYEYPNWHVIAVLLVGIITVSSFGLAWDRYADETQMVVCCAIGLIGVIGLLILGIGCFKEPTGRYRYKVTVSDEVSLNDIYETYEIVDRDGELWTLEDKKLED